ncbi:hypothetical protein YA0089_18950 [Pseudomonas viridiflava]|uniref:hypothetical protein n=1 Tax=Pseudomonas viridiflava TaxID=33069 RepID=UPI0018E5FA73|nr:hypothetical protein [Pseudomonas viridiflava]MBI6725686.1 hypothetical protein [Pseudomonas viridiflava]
MSKLNKLPKSWLHWMRESGIRPETRRRWYSGYYLKGRGRHWRVDCNGQLEVSCPFDDFDRWANSGVAEVPVPTTRAGLKQAIEDLLAAPITDD